MLKLSNIEVVYQKVILVLKGVSLEVKEKSIIALLGANGAGKSTVLKAISGLLHTELGKVTKGNITFEGRRIDKYGPEDIVQLGIVQVMERRRVFENLTVEENLIAGSSATKYKFTKANMDALYSHLPRLKDLRNNRSGYLSGGEQQMLVIGRALMANPHLLLLDEPSLGLSPLMAKEIFKIIKNINVEEGKSILLVEQNALAGVSIASYVYVMENGRMVLDGLPEQMKNNEEILAFYLGYGKAGEKISYRGIKRWKQKRMWIG
jgi:branched-chain amino acid transport system ATP-binding protein